MRRQHVPPLTELSQGGVDARPIGEIARHVPVDPLIALLQVEARDLRTWALAPRDPNIRGS